MKRRGFTLIELMVVIAIIIILAAVAIPNYLNMTERAKKSRVASDFAAVATALESYKTDWGQYPLSTSDTATEPLTTATSSLVYPQLTGTATADDAKHNRNYTGQVTAAGDTGAITYMTTNVLGSMTNPYTSAKPYEYGGKDGKHWILVVDSEIPTASHHYWSRSDTTTILADNASTKPPVP